MVVFHYFQDIIDILCDISILNLPTYKDNFIKIEFVNADDKSTVYKGPEPPLPFAESNVYLANISDWRRLTATDTACKAVYEVTFDVKDSNFKFKAGDTIGIIPENDTSDVDLIIEHLNLTDEADQSYCLSAEGQKTNKIPPHIPIKSTLRHVLKHCVDLRTILKKLFLLALSRHTRDENERKVLEYFCSKEGSNAYQTHILNGNICLLDIFNIFKSCKPPIEVLLSNLPRLLPRPYSIVNSGIKDNREIKICFSVLNLNHNRQGLTTGWLEKIINKELDIESKLKKLVLTGSNEKYPKVPIYIRKNLSGFALPEQLDNAMILISPGTGVAPFIGFLEERQIFKQDEPGLRLGNAWLFFGCRDPKLDFIYKNELEEYLSNGALSKLSTAFSRVDNETKYVQDALLQNGKEVVQLINDGASIFICGDLKTIALQVKEVLIKCLVQYGDKSELEAEQLISDMQKNKKYIVDAWS